MVIKEDTKRVPAGMEAAREAEVGRLNSNDTDPYHWSLIRISFFC